MRLPISLTLFAVSAVVVASPLGPFRHDNSSKPGIYSGEAIKSSVTVSTFTLKATNLAIFAAASPQSALDLIPVASDSAFATTPTSSAEISTAPALPSSFMPLIVSPINTSTPTFALITSSSLSASSTTYNILSGANVVLPVTPDSATTSAASAISSGKPLASHHASSFASVVSSTSHRASSSEPSSSALSTSTNTSLLSKNPNTSRPSSLPISHSAFSTTACGTFLSSSSPHIPTASSLSRPTPTGKANSELPTALKKPPVSPAMSPVTSAYPANLARAKSYNSLYANLTLESRCMPKQIACISGNVMECNATTSTFALLQICLPTSESSCFAMPDPTKPGVNVGCVNIKYAESVLGDVSSYLSSKAPTATSTVAMPSSLVDITVTQTVPQTHTVYVTATAVEAASTESPSPTKPKQTSHILSRSKHFTLTQTPTVFVTVTRTSGTEESQSPAVFSVPSTVEVVPVTLALSVTSSRHTTVVNFKSEAAAAPPAPTASPSQGNEDYDADGDRNGNALTVGVPSTVTVVKTISVIDTITLVSTTTATTTATRTTTEASTTYTQIINVIS